MTVTADEKKKAVAALTQTLSASRERLARNALLDSALKQYGFSDKEIKNRNPAAKCNTIRSYIGTALTDLIARGEILKRNDGYTLPSRNLVTVEKPVCREVMLSFLKNKPHTKKELSGALIRHFGADRTASLADDDAIKNLCGQLLAELIDEGRIAAHDGQYALAVLQQQLPNKPLTEAEFERALLGRLCDKGGKFFEKFVANMLEKYFLITGRDVTACDVIGGSEDGGVDVVIDTVEDLGFVEHILVQAKCRKNIQVSEKEVREFYGAMTAQRGTRGIFITTCTFHPGADKLLRSIPNCVGVDGHLVFELAKRTAYGIHKTKEGFMFDESVF